MQRLRGKRCPQRLFREASPERSEIKKLENEVNLWQHEVENRTRSKDGQLCHVRKNLAKIRTSRAEVESEIHICEEEKSATLLKQDKINARFTTFHISLVILTH